VTKFFLAVAVVSLSFVAGIKAQERRQKWVVTFSIPFTTTQPVVVQADSRVDAIGQIGLTVWSESEWQNACEHFKGTDSDCRTHPPIDYRTMESAFYKQTFDSCVKAGGKVDRFGTDNALCYFPVKVK
jgi:hypothetical protein